MTIKPLKEYSKPLYAIGIASALTALALTGCTDPNDKGDKEVDYAGGLAICAEETSETKPTINTLELEGMI